MENNKSLYTLFLMEICEGFSFYGIGAILTLFMVQFLNLNLSFALLIYGVYSGLVYITTLIGGHLCDNYIGSRKIINIGSIIMTLGLFLLSYDASLTQPLTPLHSSFLFNYPEIILIFSLMFTIIGAGFLRIGIASIVPEIYELKDKIESNFTLLNMALNIGMISASLILGIIVGETLNLYKYGFFILGISLVILIVIYNLFRNKYLVNLKGEIVGLKPIINKIPKKINENIKLSKIEKNHIKLIIIIQIIALIFFIGFEVIDSTLMFFAKDYVIKSVTVFNITPEMIKFIEPLGVIIFSPIILTYFNRKKDENNSLILKIILGICALLITYIIFFSLAIMADGGIKNINIIFIIIMELIRSTAEILVLPIILSLISEFAPKKYLSRLMGLFYCCLAGSYTLSGVMAGFYPDKNSGIIHYLFGIIPVTDFKTFSLIFIIMYIILLILILISKNKIKKLMQ
ncbi:MAG: MFS transporter [archaeon]|nr:MFS transporter [archaeon]